MARCPKCLLVASIFASAMIVGAETPIPAGSCEVGETSEEAATLPGPVNLVQVNVDLNEVAAQHAASQSFVAQLPFADFVQLSGGEEVGARVPASVTDAVESMRTDSGVAQIDVDGAIRITRATTSVSKPTRGISLFQQAGQAVADRVNSSSDGVPSLAGASMANATATLVEPYLFGAWVLVAGRLTSFYSTLAAMPPSELRSCLQRLWLFWLVLVMAGFAVFQAFRSRPKSGSHAPPRGKQSDEALGYLFRHHQRERERQVAQPGEPGFVGYARM